MSDLIAQFQSEMNVEVSSRSHILMLMGFFGYSGGGKTVTALIAATGLAGRDAKIGIVDSEQKRSGLASDVVKSLALQRYGKTPEIVAIYIEPPFHPLKYVAALKKLQEVGCKAIVIDSMTASWSGEGGYLDLKEQALTKMAGDDWKKREACAMAAAARTKPTTHAKMVDAILHANVPVILCFRGKEKTTIEKNDQGKNAPKKDEFATPVHEGSLIYEMLISGECLPNDKGEGGFCRFAGPGCKHTHPDLLQLLPRPDEQFGFHHAEAIAKWCANPGAPVVPAGPGISADPRKSLLTEIRTATKSIHKWTGKQDDWDRAKGVMEGWLVGNGIIGETAKLSDLPIERLQEVLNETKAAIAPKEGQLL